MQQLTSLGLARVQFFIMESGVVRVDLRLLDSASPGGAAHRQRLPADLLREAPARSLLIPFAEHPVVMWLTNNVCCGGIA